MGLGDSPCIVSMSYVGFTADGGFYQSVEGSKTNTRFFVPVLYVPAAMFDEPHLSKRTMGICHWRELEAPLVRAC